MRVCYRDELFDAQFLRTLSHSCYGGADVAECWNAARQIPEKDVSRWFEVWMELAARVQADAERSRKLARKISAREGFLRASNYYRNAYVFLFSEQQEPELRSFGPGHVAACHFPLQTPAARETLTPSAASAQASDG